VFNVRFYNANFSDIEIAIKRSWASLITDIKTTLGLVVGTLLTLGLAIATMEPSVAIKDKISVRDLLVVLSMSAIVWAPGLLFSIVGFLSLSNCLIDFRTDCVYIGVREWGAIDDIESIVVESAVPSGFKVQYRVALKSSSGKVIPLAITPCAPTVLDAFTHGNPFGKLRGVIRLTWTSNPEYFDPGNVAYQEMAGFQKKITEAVEEYRSRKREA